MRRTLAFSLLFVAFTLPLFGQRTITVDLNGGGDFTEIQPAIDAAGDGDTVLVKPGEYVISEPITFRGKGVTVRGKNGAEETTIRMAERPLEPGRASVIVFESNESEESILEGFTLTGGRGSPGFVGQEGGGVRCQEDASPRLLACTITGNSADFGGGIWGGSGTLTNCTISGNSARWEGGGLSAFDGTLTNCTITGNSGGGVVSYGGATLTNCIVWGNTGGSLVVVEGAEPNVSYSCLETEEVWPGAGNMNSEPLFCGYAGPVEVFVDAGNPEPGDGSEGSPFRELSRALEYRLSLQANSPCVGTGRDGGNMGADHGTCEHVGVSRRAVYLASGRYSLEHMTLAHGASLIGVGAEETVLEGTVYGLRSGAKLARLSVTAGTCGGVVIPPGEDPTVENCTITGNSSGSPGGDGGGVFCDRNSSPTLRNCRITGNSASSRGGGVYCSGSSPILTNCVIAKNSAGSGIGSGVYCDSSATLTNCTITGNSGDGVDCWGGSSPILTNCTISANSSRGVYWTPISSPALTNCIVWANGKAGLLHTGSAARVSFSCFEGGESWPGDGNIGADPLFVDPDADDYRLQPGSPAMDAGSWEGAPATDFDGNSRPCGTGVDMGAYELCQGQLPAVPFLRGDVNSDGRVSLSDALMLRRWLSLGGHPPVCQDTADADDDGQLDGLDADRILAETFGEKAGEFSIAQPYPEPGDDPTGDDLVCVSYGPTAPFETDDLVRLGDLPAVPGQRVDIPVFVRSSFDVEAYQLVVRYDPDVLEPLGGALDLHGTFYQGRLDGSASPFVRVQPVPEEGILVAGFCGSLDQEGFGVPAGEEVLVGRIPALVARGTEPGQEIPLVLVGSSGDLGTELTYQVDGELVTVRPSVEGGVLKIVPDITFFRGDANSDQSVNVSDAVFTLDYLFAGGADRRRTRHSLARARRRHQC